MTDTADPRNVNSRLYNQIATLLDDLEAEDIREKLDIKERIAAIIAIGRIQIMFVNLRKENPNVARPRAGAGSTARKYASAFRAKAHATRRGAKVAGRRSAAADDIGDDGGFADDAAE